MRGFGARPQGTSGECRKLVAFGILKTQLPHVVVLGDPRPDSQSQIFERAVSFFDSSRRGRRSFDKRDCPGGLRQTVRRGQVGPRGTGQAAVWVVGLVSQRRTSRGFLYVPLEAVAVGLDVKKIGGRFCWRDDASFPTSRRCNREATGFRRQGGGGSANAAMISKSEEPHDNRSFAVGGCLKKRRSHRRGEEQGEFRKKSRSSRCFPKKPVWGGFPKNPDNRTRSAIRASRPGR